MFNSRFDMCTHGKQLVIWRAVILSSVSVDYECDVSYNYMHLLIATFL